MNWSIGKITDENVIIFIINKICTAKSSYYNTDKHIISLSCGRGKKEKFSHQCSNKPLIILWLYSGPPSRSNYFSFLTRCQSYMPTPALDPKLLNDGLYIVAYFFYKHTLCFSVQEQFSTKKKERKKYTKKTPSLFFLYMDHYFIERKTQKCLHVAWIETKKVWSNMGWLGGFRRVILRAEILF